MNYWKIAPWGTLWEEGTGDERWTWDDQWQECIARSRITVGWGWTGDLSYHFELGRGQAQARVQEALRDNAPSEIRGEFKSSPRCANAASQLLLLREFALGDIVVANKGQCHVFGVGRVTKAYRYQRDLKPWRDFPHEIGVGWLWTATEEAAAIPIRKQKGWLRTVMSLTGPFVREVGLHRWIPSTEIEEQTLVEFEESATDVQAGVAEQHGVRRLGQAEFRVHVLRLYDGKCAMCEISDEKLLEAAHIVRFADDADLRGRLANGICLCALHHKAFEHGYISIGDDYRIIVHSEYRCSDDECRRLIAGIAGKAIRVPKLRAPDRAQLKRHRARHGFE